MHIHLRSNQESKHRFKRIQTSLQRKPLHALLYVDVWVCFKVLCGLLVMGD